MDARSGFALARDAKASVDERSYSPRAPSPNVMAILGMLAEVEYQAAAAATPEPEAPADDGSDALMMAAVFAVFPGAGLPIPEIFSQIAGAVAFVPSRGELLSAAFSPRPPPAMTPAVRGICASPDWERVRADMLEAFHKARALELREGEFGGPKARPRF